MKWDIWNSLEYDEAAAGRLAAQVGSPLVAAVLCARGIDTPEGAAAFLDTDIRNLHDPMGMADMDRGASRLRRAIAQGEKVAVYGDYDVDGITASALMAGYLRDRGLDCPVYIPDRLEEGYGLNRQALRALAEDGVTLVITVDCGITAIAETAYAGDLGIDMVITDHHECQATLPGAVAVINPKRPDCPYPDKDLAGVGVAFKLVSAIEGPDRAAELTARYGDLVAVGTVADVMNLTGENRIFVQCGLEAIRRGSRVGLTKLIHEAGLEPDKVSVTNIGYGLAPRINAAGRMGSAELALDLLITREESLAEELADRLCGLNRRRQQVEGEILEEALEALDHSGYREGPIILASEKWHKGVVGIVASRLVERYRAPVVMLCIEGNEAKGSCRSGRGFSLFDALMACGDELSTFGGHELAAGLTVDLEHLEGFKAAFGAYYRENPPTGEAGALEADFTLRSPELIGLEQVKSLELLEPCGRGNPSPILVMDGARLTRVQAIGGGRHLRLQVEKWGHTYDCVFFSVTPEEFSPREGDMIDLAFTPQINRFRGRTTVQLLVKDVCPAGWRQTARARRLYSKLEQGADLTAGEAAALCPERGDFVFIWRSLSARQTARTKLEEVLAGLSQGAGAGATARYYTCLKVFDELGLLDLEEGPGGVDIRLHRQAEKVDLESSRVLTALRRAMG